MTENTREVRMKKFVLILIAFYATGPIAAFGDEPVAGSIKKVHGEASIQRAETSLEARTGEKVLKNDLLKTGKASSLSMVFKDDTLLSLGPESEVAINEFLFSPAQGQLSIVTRMIKGTCAYISGIIGKLSPESVRFETPVANIGIRGTKFAVSVEDPPGK